MFLASALPLSKSDNQSNFCPRERWRVPSVVFTRVGLPPPHTRPQAQVALITCLDCRRPSLSWPSLCPPGHARPAVQRPLPSQ